MREAAPTRDTQFQPLAPPFLSARVLHRPFSMLPVQVSLPRQVRNEL